jgi:hypothetical protein
MCSVRKPDHLYVSDLGVDSWPTQYLQNSRALLFHVQDQWINNNRSRLSADWSLKWLSLVSCDFYTYESCLLIFYYSFFTFQSAVLYENKTLPSCKISCIALTSRSVNWTSLFDTTQTYPGHLMPKYLAHHHSMFGAKYCHQTVKKLKKMKYLVGQFRTPASTRYIQVHIVAKLLVC